MFKTVITAGVAVMLLTGAGAASTQYTCALTPVSPKSDLDLPPFTLVVDDAGGSQLTGIENRALRVHQTARKVRANWRAGIYKITATIDKSSGKANTNLQADGYTGHVRWQGTCQVN